MRSGIEGIIPVMVTPMHENGEIDYPSLEELVNKLALKGVYGLFILGSTGEGIKLKREERKKVIEKTCEVAKGKTKIIAGIGSITTEESIALTKDAENAGADYVVINPPYYFKPTMDALLQHYKKIAESTALPVILYNYPALAGYWITPETVKKASEIDNIVGIKDSSGDMQYFQELLKIEDFCVIQGFGSLFLPSLALGCRATMPGEGNIATEELVKLHKAFLSGDMNEARAQHSKIALVTKIFNIGTFPANLKYAMNLLALPGGYAREPCALTNEEMNEIKKFLNLYRNKSR